MSASRTKKTKAKTDEPSFEVAMEQLEEVVGQLESGDIPLEESLAAFEKGVALVRLLHGRLDSVQAKVEELVRGQGGSLSTEALDADDTE